MGTLHSHSELQITKQSQLGRILKTHSFPSPVSLEYTQPVEPPLSAVSIPIGNAPPGAEQRGIQDAENPTGETEVDLAMSI